MKKIFRINRKQFFIKAILPLILLSILNIILSIVFIFQSMYIQILFQLLSLIFIIVFLPNLIIWRCHDFNNEWKKEKYFTLLILSIKYLLWWIVILGVLLWYIRIWMMSWEFLDLPLLKPILIWISWVSFIILTYLFIRPWTKWKNNFLDNI